MSSLTYLTIITLISEAFRLSGFYNKIYNRYFIFYFVNKEMKFKDNKFLDYINNNSHYLGITDLLNPQPYTFKLREI